MQRFMRVTPYLVRGGAPSEDEVHSLKNDFGINRIVSLDTEEGERIEEVCQELGIEHIQLGIDSKNIETALSNLDDNIVELLTENPNVFVHCFHGKDRTGLAVALYRIRVEGWKPMDALAEAMNYGFGVGVSPKIRHMYCKMILNHPDDGTTDDSRQRKRKIRKIVLEDMNDVIPQVGAYDGVSTTLRGTIGLPISDRGEVFPPGHGFIL